MSDLHNLDAERHVIGGVLLDPETLPDLRGILTPASFYRAAHALLWTHLEAMDDDGTPVDLVALAARVLDAGQAEAAGGISYVTSLCDEVPSTVNLDYYARIVQDHAQRRRLRDVCRMGIDAVDEMADPTDIAAELIKGADGVTEVAVDSLRTASEVLAETWQDMTERCEAVERGDPPPGLDLGWGDVRKIIAPQAGDLLVIAGRPGMGKSALASQAATWVAEHGGGVVSLQLEMPARVEMGRILCREARVDMTRWRDGKLTSEDRRRLTEVADYVHRLPLYIDDTPGQSIASVRAAIHRAARRFARDGRRLDLVVVDYLQLMEASAKSGDRTPREQQISAMSRGLKVAARRYGCVVAALSQLNRGVEARENKRPRMSDLRESGAIEQDADGVIFIYRDDYYREDSPDRGTAEIIVAKNRHGAQGMARLAWLGEFTRFDALESRVVPFSPRMTPHHGESAPWGER